MKTIISAQNLDVYIGQKKLLSDINLDIQEGQVIKLSGPNGCGKTTLLEYLIGLRSSNAIKRYFTSFEYSYLPQISELSPKISLKLGEICSKSFSFYPENLMKHHWSYASGGEKMKSLIAKSLYGDSRVIFLDEPFNHLDAKSCKLLEQEIQKKVEAGLTIIYIGHQSFSLDQKIVEVEKWN